MNLEKNWQIQFKSVYSWNEIHNNTFIVELFLIYGFYQINTDQLIVNYHSFRWELQ